MANFNLTNQKIKDTYEQLAQIGTSSLLLDGTGSIVTSLELTASRAVSASWAPTADLSGYVKSNEANTFTLPQTIDYAGGDASLVLTGSNVNTIRSFGDDQTVGALQLRADTSGRIMLTLGAQQIVDVRETYVDITEEAIISTRTTTPIVSGSWGEIKEGTNFLTIQNNESGIKLLDPNGNEKLKVENAGVTVDGTLNATTLIGDLDYSLLSGVPSGIVSSSAQLPSGIISGASQLDNTSLNLNTITASHAEITGDLIVQGTASFAYLQSVTGSVKKIGDAFVQVNNDTPTQRFGGIKVVDSGSGAATASFMFDGENQDWMYQYDKDATDYAIAIFGPEFSDTNSPIYPASNVIQKGTGGHHLTGSIITDDGSTVTVAGNVSASAYYGDGSNLSGVNAGLVSGTGTDSIQSEDNLTTTAASAIGPQSIAIGNAAKVSGTASLHISLDDSNTYVAGDQTINIGKDINNTGGYSTAIGHNLTNTGTGGNVLIGRSVTTAGDYSIGIGEGATANSQGGIAIGNNANSSGNSVAIGNGATMGNSYGAALGVNARANNDASIAVGGDVNVSSNQAIAIGTDTTIDGSSQGAVALGQDADISTSPKAVTLGQGVQASGASGGVAIGSGSSISSAAEINIGGVFKYDGSSDVTFGKATAVDFGENISSVTSGSATGSLIDNLHPAAASSSAQIQHIVTLNQGQYDLISGSGGANADTFYIISDATDDVFPDNLQVNGQIFSPTHAGSVASATSSIDFNNGNFATLDLTVSTFLANPSNLKSGTTYTIILDSGSLISGHGDAFKFAGGTAPTYSDNTDVLTMVSDGTNLYATALTDFS